MSDLPPPPWGTSGGGAPPPNPYGAPGPHGAPGGPPGYGTPGYAGTTHGGSAPGTNGLAIGSLVTALVGIPVMLFCFLGWIPWIVALVLGLVALSQIKASGGTQGGRGLAIGGIAVAGACLALSIIGAIVFFVFLAEVADDLCDDDRDGDGFDECVDDDDFDPTVGDEPFGFTTTTDPFGFSTSTSVPR